MPKPNAYNPNAPDYRAVHRNRFPWGGAGEHRVPIWDPCQPRSANAGKPSKERVWCATYNGLEATVSAPTKSEARSRLKRWLKFGRKRRLPVGMVVQKVAA